MILLLGGGGKSGSKNKPKIRPVEKDCRILVNGTAIAGETDLDHNDRLVFGSTHLWVFQNPLEPGVNKKQYPPVSYEYAQEEIAAKAGINFSHAGSGDVALLQQDLLETMPAIEEANSISEELDKRVKFEIMLVAPDMVDKLGHKAEGFEGRDRLSKHPEVGWCSRRSKRGSPQC